MSDSTEVLRLAAQARERATTQRILEAVADLRRQGLRVTVSAISQTARVSRTSVYARPEILRSARRQDPLKSATTDSRRHGPKDEASVTGLRRRLEASQARNRRLTADNDRLRLELSVLLGKDGP